MVGEALRSVQEVIDEQLLNLKMQLNELQQVKSEVSDLFEKHLVNEVKRNTKHVRKKTKEEDHPVQLLLLNENINQHDNGISHEQIELQMDTEDLSCYVCSLQGRGIRAAGVQCKECQVSVCNGLYSICWKQLHTVPKIQKEIRHRLDLTTLTTIVAREHEHVGTTTITATECFI